MVKARGSKRKEPEELSSDVDDDDNDDDDEDLDSEGGDEVRSRTHPSIPRARIDPVRSHRSRAHTSIPH